MGGKNRVTPASHRFVFLGSLLHFRSPRIFAACLPKGVCTYAPPDSEERENKTDFILIQKIKTKKMVKKVGNLIPNTFFIAKGSGDSDLEKHAGSYHMALFDAGIADFNIMTYSSVIPATAHPVMMDEVDLPPFGSELKTIMAVSHGYQDECISAGLVYAWMYKDENFDEKAGGLVCEVSGRYRIEELEARLIRVINDLHQRTYSRFYLGDLNFVTEGMTIERRYGTALAALCFTDFIMPDSADGSSEVVRL